MRSLACLLASLGLVACSILDGSTDSEDSSKTPGADDPATAPTDQPPADKAPGKKDPSPGLAKVTVGSEAKLASGAIAMLAAHGDKVLYAVFTVGQKDFRVEVASAKGGAPKVLHQGTLPQAVDAIRVENGDARFVADLWMERTQTADGHVALALPGTGSVAARDLAWVDLDAGTLSVFERGVYLYGDMIEREGVLFYWHAEGPTELSWRLPSGTIVDAGKASAPGDRRRAVAVSQGVEKIAFLSSESTNAYVTVVDPDGSNATDITQYPPSASNNCAPQLEFAGKTLVYNDCLVDFLSAPRPRVSAWKAGASSPTTLYVSPEPPQQTYDDDSITDWWTVDGLVVLEDRPYTAYGGNERILAVSDMSGVATKVDTELVRRSTDGRSLVYQVKDSLETRVASPIKPGLPTTLTFDVNAKPGRFGIGDGGKWVAATRAGGGATVFFGTTPLTLPPSVNLFGDEVHPLGGGQAACWPAVGSVACIDQTGTFETAKSGASRLVFLRAVGANGAVFVGGVSSDHAEPVFVSIQGGGPLRVETATKNAMDVRATDDALFYLIGGSAGATLAGRTLH